MILLFSILSVFLSAFTGPGVVELIAFWMLFSEIPQSHFVGCESEAATPGRPRNLTNDVDHVEKDELIDILAFEKRISVSNPFILCSLPLIFILCLFLVITRYH